MKLQGMFKCPQCGGEFDACRPSGPGRIWAHCVSCSLVVIIEDYKLWLRRAQRRKQQKTGVHGSKSYSGTLVYPGFDTGKTKEIEKKEKDEYNPTER